jgi:polygalacturonase
VTIENSFADGIDPDCCRNVRIADCRVDSVDDGICLKASLALGERVSTEHVEISAVPP